MPLSSLIAPILEKLDDPAQPNLVEWRRENPEGKAVGYFPVYVPVELIHAAGMLPVMVAGSGGLVKLDEADAHLQSFVCLVGRSTLELHLDGSLDVLDAMLFPSTCEISRGLSGVWSRHDPDKPVIYIHYPQNLRSRSARNYMISELTRLKEKLEKISGIEITPDKLRNSISLYNRRMELLNELDRIRSDRPEILKASEYYIIRMAGMSLTLEKHIDLLASVIAELDKVEPLPEPKLRMVMLGAFCERPPVTMLEVIENEGVAIVSDDLLQGENWWQKPVPIEGDPLENLADHFINYSVPNMVTFKQACDTCSSVLNTIKDRNADGVIITSSRSCQPAQHEVTCIMRACEENGIPYIRLQYEEEQHVFESTRVIVEALIEARERLPIAGTDPSREESDQ